MFIPHLYRKNVALVTLIISFFYLPLSAQVRHSSVHGVIRDYEGNPLPGVNVTIKGTTTGAVSDIEGRYLLPGVSTKKKTLVYSFSGYETVEKEINVSASEHIVDVTLHPKSVDLKGVEVVGSREKGSTKYPSTTLRLNTPFLEIPQNIQVVDSATLRGQQIISMSDGLIRNVSGLLRIGHWGDSYTNIVARGSQVQAFRNGFNAVNSSWGPLTEDMSFVERIEFIKGPAGFMLANGNPSGLYNVVTKKPTGRPQREITFTTGSFHLYRGTIDVDGKLSRNGRLLYRLNLAAKKQKSFRPNEYNHRYVVAPVISYQISNKIKVTAEYIYQRANASNLGSYYTFSSEGYAKSPVNATFLPEGIPSTTTNDHNATLTVDYAFAPKWALVAQGTYFNYYQNGSSLWLASPPVNDRFIRRISIMEAKSAMLMAQAFLNGAFTTGAITHKILVGFDMARKHYLADFSQTHDLDKPGEEFDPSNPNLGLPSNGYPAFDQSKPLEARILPYGNQDQRYVSAYVQDELTFFDDKLRLTVAGRFTHVRQAQYGSNFYQANRFTPRAGLSYSLGKSLSLYGMYDQAFTPQAGTRSDGQPTVPITGGNLEFGIKRDWFGSRFSSTLAVYRIFKNHQLVGDPNAPLNSGLMIELGQKIAQGIEVDFRGNITNELSVVANYAYTDSKVSRVTEGVSAYKVGDPVPSFAKHTANAWLTYRLSRTVLKGLGISLGTTILSGRVTNLFVDAATGAPLPNYFKFDAGLSWENAKFSATFNVFNLLNAYLYDGHYAPSLKIYATQAEAPRNLRITLGYRF